MFKNHFLISYTGQNKNSCIRPIFEHTLKFLSVRQIVCAHAQKLACVCMHVNVSMGQDSDLLMDIKRSWPAPHQNPSLEPPTLSHTHPALCRVRECDLVPIPEEGWKLLTTSDTFCAAPSLPLQLALLAYQAWTPWSWSTVDEACSMAKAV